MPAGKKQEKIVLSTIDLGAHSARMLIAEVNCRTREVTELEELEVSIPIGSNVFQRGRIHNDTMRMLCGIFANFRKKMKEYGVTHYRAIGTSAVREASNSEILIERIRHATGIELRIFEGTDEARLDYLTVMNDVPARYGFRTKSTLIADIGTGACQVSSYESGRLCFTETIKVGTLRVLELMPHTVSSSAILQYLTPVIDKSFSELEHIASSLQSEYIIAMGSSVRMLMSIFSGNTEGKRKKKKPAPLPVSKDAFEEMRSVITSLSIEEICDEYDIAQDLGEAVIPCFIIIDNLFKITGARMLLVPMTSMKHGLLQDYMNELILGEDYFEKQIYEMVRMTAFKYRCFNEYTKRVVDFAEKLFDKLQTLHGLGHRELILLKIAACLHKSGLFVNNQGYHKHSYYIISNTEIPGISLRERRITALLARYHRKALPRSQHPEYMALSETDRSIVNRLAPILRLACALALQSGDASGLQIRIGTDRVVIAARGMRAAHVGAVPEIDLEYFNYAYALQIVLE